MIYTEEDATADSILLMSEIVDFDKNWIGVEFLPTMNRYRSRGSSQKVDNLTTSIYSHLQNLRFLKFASEAIEVEFSNHQISSEQTIPILPPKFEYTSDFPPFQAFEHGKVLDIKFPLKLCVVDIVGIEQMLQRQESTELKDRQLKKDVERDRILLNGVRISGADIGIEGVIHAVGSICDTVLSECVIAPLEQDLKSELIRVVLGKASRTHSGGITFQALQSIIDGNQKMLMPQSSITPPIQLKIYAGAFPTSTTFSFSSSGTFSPQTISSEKRWGLICAVKCESIFQVQDRDVEDMDRAREGQRPPVMVRSTYEDFIMLEVKLLPLESRSDDQRMVWRGMQSARKGLRCCGPILGSSVDSGTVVLSSFQQRSAPSFIPPAS